MGVGEVRMYLSSWIGVVVTMTAINIILEGSVAAASTTHVVGGATNWTIPSATTFYSDWSSSQTFAVGDTLVFNFPTGIHNVIPVPKSGYDGCSSKQQLGTTMANGPATVTISSPGIHYYICGIGSHCSFGQKLAITVASSSTSSPTATPSPSPTAGSGGAPNSPAGPTSPGAAAAGPSTSASSLLRCRFSFTVVAFIFAVIVLI
ncbi:cucumber peeling cupredoxin-like [Typha angustifolia]|uniref:cucumber peeling cupredoxin-like n=1 Tax=Typha angustifolia TaxID=59011 RepID=UPI003C2F3C5C